LKTPREVRNVLRYVLLNRKHHDAGKKFDKYWIDPYSSAAWFGGWAQSIRIDAHWKRELVEMKPPTAKPTVWLLTTGWRKHGALRFDEHRLGLRCHPFSTRTVARSNEALARSHVEPR